MSIQIVIYLASVADNVRFCLIGHSIAFAVASFSFLMASDMAPKDIEKKRKKISFIFVILCGISGIILAAIPSGLDIYKIAGVTEQQKAQIDAQGKVVK